MTFRAALLLPVLLLACGPAPVRLSVPPVPAAERIPVGVRSIEVLDVSLPLYATEDRIYVQDASGGISALGGVVWADEQPRSVTLDLTRALGTVTGVRVAPSPWPFAEPAAVRLDVRVAEILALPDQGVFLLRGQVYAGARDLGTREAAREFRITVPIVGEGPGAIAAAQGAATVALAQEIARSL
jgi:uncharacterized protein